MENSEPSGYFSNLYLLLSDTLNSDIPVYWLVAIIFLLLTTSAILFVISGRKNHLLNQASSELRCENNRVRDDLQSIRITDAENSQKIESLDRALNELKDEKKELIAKTEKQTEDIKAMTASNAALHASQTEKIEQIAELKQKYSRLEFDLRELNLKISSQDSDIREKNTALQAEKEKLDELKSQFTKQKNDLKTEFKVISEDIMKQRQQSLSQQNKEGIGTLLKPLQEQINQFQQRVNEVHVESVKGNATIEEVIKRVMDVGLKMRDEASNLTSALKGDSQKRGAWGEAQLERTLEMSGLIEGTHFEKQSSFQGENGKNKRTDYIIKLPGNKHIIIDSKVSLIAYDRALSLGESEQGLAMDEHISAVKKHIDDLESKEYTNIGELQSPDFILMFMPVEPAYIEALKHAKDLFGYGYAKNVILVSHTTLIPILRTVANLWMLDRSSREAREIGDKAADIYNSVARVSARLRTLGNTLNAAGKHYNETVTSVAGVQGLQGKVERFTQVSNKAKVSMPELESRNIEFETSRLEFKALEIPELLEASTDPG